MKNLLSLLPVLFIISCGPNNTTTTTTQTGPNYTNACCCNTIFSVGTGKIYVPSMFTPNADGINDGFRIIGDTNIKFITNVAISDASNIVIKTIDTMFGSNAPKWWDGKLNSNATHEGIFSCSFNVVDKTNTSTTSSGNSATYTQTVHANGVIANYVNCKFEDQLDFGSFTIPYITNETKFQ